MLDCSPKKLRLIVLLFLFMGGLSSKADMVGSILEKTGVRGGLAVVIGGDGSLEQSLAQTGVFMVEGLRTDMPEVLATRSALAEAGVFPLANVQWHPDLPKLPYAPRLVNLLVADLDGLANSAPSAEEIRRVLTWGGKAYLKQGGDWRILGNPKPAEADEWPHALRGADRIPVSTDGYITSNLDGLKWVADHWKNIEQRGAAILISDGKQYTVRTSFNREARRAGKWPRSHTLMARDAQNGLMLWSRPLAWVPSFSFREYSQSYNSHLAAGNNRVYAYLEIGGHLTALDGDTGEVVQVYQETPVLEAGSQAIPLPGRKFDDGITPLKNPDWLASSTVMLKGKGLVQVYGPHIRVLNESDGRLLGSRDLAYVGQHALIGEDGHLYVVGEGNLESYTLPDLSPRWRSEVTEQVKLMTGPRNGVLPLTGFVEFVKRKAFINGRIYGFDTETGQTLWTRDEYVHGGGHVVMMDNYLHIDGWKNGTYLDPRTGNKVGGHSVDFDVGGCSFPTFVPGYMIRGLTLHSLEDENDILIGDGVRPLCQNPMFPALGHVYSFGTNCGCSVFYRAGLSAFYPADTPDWTPEERRLAAWPDLRAPAMELKATELDIGLVHDWRRGEGFYPGTKGYNYKRMPREVLREQGRSGGVQKGGFNLYGAANKWGGPLDRETEAEGWKVVSGQHSNLVRAKQGGNVKWTLPIGGRLLSDPLVLDGTVYLGLANGWVHAVELATGRVKWSHQAAPADRRVVAFGQVESAWPVVGVQFLRGHLVCVAGRRDSFDEGIFIRGLDPKTGRKRWEQNIAIPTKQYDSVQAAKKDGYAGFGAKLSTQAFTLWQGDDEETFWMLGADPVKIPPAN